MLMHLLYSLLKSNPAHRPLARALGFASIAIGLTEICCPQKLQSLMGLRGSQKTGILRVLGIREVMHGVDLLTHKNPRPGLLARLLGDGIDGFLLGSAFKASKRPTGLLAVFALVTPIIFLDLLLSRHRNHPR